MYLYVTNASFVCHSHVICMSPVCACILSVCARMSFLCHWYVLVCHFNVTFMYSYVMVFHLYVLVFHTYVTRMYSYVIRMSLVCDFTMNRSLPVRKTWCQFNFLNPSRELIEEQVCALLQ